jgi:hypothetical protein
LGLHEQAISLGLDCTRSRFNVGDVKLDPGGEVFWGPMAYVIIGGLVSATLLTLFFLPALYVVLFRIREPQETSTGAEPKAPVAVRSAGAAS